MRRFLCNKACGFEFELYTLQQFDLDPIINMKIVVFWFKFRRSLFPWVNKEAKTLRPREMASTFHILSISLSYLKVVLFLFKFFGNVFLGSSGQHVSFVQIMAGCRFGDKPLSEHCKQEVVNLTTLLVVPPETTYLSNWQYFVFQWTNCGLVYWRRYASLGIDQLNQTLCTRQVKVRLLQVQIQIHVLYFHYHMNISVQLQSLQRNYAWNLISHIYEI